MRPVRDKEVPWYWDVDGDMVGIDVTHKGKALDMSATLVDSELQSSGIQNRCAALQSNVRCPTATRSLSLLSCHSFVGQSGTMNGTDVVAFGNPMRDHFLLAKDYLPLNHGSFGTYPKSVRDELRKWQDLSEARPDNFIRYDYPKLLDSARDAMAAFLHVPAREVVFLQNATTGINTVLRSLVFQPGDVILHFSTVYGAVEKTVEYICETTPAESSTVKLEYPLGDDDVVAKFVGALEKLNADGKKVRVAIFDTVSSMPGVMVPWEKLVGICREHGVLSMVDGAHGAGHIELNLGRVQPDFFVSNCHK